MESAEPNEPGATTEVAVQESGDAYVEPSEDATTLDKTTTDTDTNSDPDPKNLSKKRVIATDDDSVKKSKNEELNENMNEDTFASSLLAEEQLHEKPDEEPNEETTKVDDDKREPGKEDDDEVCKPEEHPDVKLPSRIVVNAVLHDAEIKAFIDAMAPSDAYASTASINLMNSAQVEIAFDEAKERAVKIIDQVKKVK